MQQRLLDTRTLFLLAALIPVAFAACPETGTKAVRPNILFIAIDDLNDWVEPLGGHPQVQTPHISRLASRGTTFTNAHTQAPLCNPSRTSLMLGLRPSTTGIYALRPWFRDVEELSGRVTLPQYLGQHGYRTLSAGKIYHGRYGREGGEFDVLGPGTEVGARPPQKLVDTPQNHPLMDWGLFPHRDEDKGDWKVARWSVEQLEGGIPEPFFLSAGFFLPHVPCYATRKWFDLYPESGTQLPPMRVDDRGDTPHFSWFLHWKLPEPRLRFLQESDQWTNLVRSYLASISFVDSLIGWLLDTLDGSPYAGNTIVVLWSDHGWHLGEKLITGKNTLWDRSTRVPLIFAGPGVTQGVVSNRPAELLDIYPTLAELAGLPPKEDLEGHSLVPQLKDPEAHREWPAVTTHNRNNHGVRTEGWRYIRYADGSEELYDMRNDPNEWTNLAGEPAHAARIEELRGWLPSRNARPAPGSAVRILTYENGQANWEGEDILPGDPIPEI